MANDDLRFMPAADLAAAIARRKVSPVDAVKAVLDAIDDTKTLNAWVTVDADAALKAARATERAAMRRGGGPRPPPRGPLRGEGPLLPQRGGPALAAGMAPLHIGTDGGGSIRKPSAFTGTFGLKASYGRVPVYPASAAWSVSHVGPMTRTVKDAALMLNVIAGPDERDPYSLPAERVDYVKALKGSLKGLRVAYSETLGLAPAVDPEARNATAKAARVFRELGCRVEATNPSWASP